VGALGRPVSELPWASSGEPGEVLAVVRRSAGLPALAAHHAARRPPAGDRAVQPSVIGLTMSAMKSSPLSARNNPATR
jgi:hypothetical protein